MPAVRTMLLLALLALPAMAQQLQLPQPSPLARAMQTVGLTEITIEYSSPGAKGRQIFGGVVPFGKLWRTGANSATRITFSKDVEIGGTKVPAGSYSIFTIPEKDSWTFIVNKNEKAGTDEYKQAEDVVRVSAKPQTEQKREHLTFVFADTTDAGTTLDLEWDTLGVGLPIKAFTDEQVTAAIASLEKNSWRPLGNAARYMLDTKKDYAAGLKLIDQSIALDQNWSNLWLKARLLNAAGKKDEARKLAERVQQLGEKAGPAFFAAEDVKKALAEWR